MGRYLGVKIPDTAVFPPIPENFKPVFLVGRNAIKATVSIELNAVFKDASEVPRLKEQLRLALWHAAVAGTDKLE